jgi:hypothetical protein
MIAALINKFLIMKKSILNLGKALNKAEQKQIQGGYIALPPCGDEFCTVPGGCIPKGHAGCPYYY